MNHLITCLITATIALSGNAFGQEVGTENSSETEERSDESIPRSAEPASPSTTAKKPGQRTGANRGGEVLPWVLVSFFATTAIALVVYLILQHHQRRFLGGLRKRIIAGTEPVTLLNDEALELIGSFRKQLESEARAYQDQLKDQRVAIERAAGEARQAAEESLARTEETVGAFKAQLNQVFPQLTKKLSEVVEHSGKTREEASKSREYAGELTELLTKKDKEIEALSEGQHLMLIKPLLHAFLQARDELAAIAAQPMEAEIAQQLAAIDQEIVNALHELGVEEVPIPANPEDIDAKLWTTLGAPKETDDPTLHGQTAGTPIKGYRLFRPDGTQVVVRKAVVTRYVMQAAVAGHGEPLPSGESEVFHSINKEPQPDNPESSPKP